MSLMCVSVNAIIALVGKAGTDRTFRALPKLNQSTR